MLILQVTHRFLPEHIGGIAAYTLNLSLQLSNSHRVRIFSCTHNQSDNGNYEEDMEYSGLAVRKVSCNCQSIKPVSIATFKNRAVVEKFEKFIRESTPDIVHIQHSDELPVDLASVCKQYGVPVVLTLHDYTFVCPTEYLIDTNGELCERIPGRECLNCVIPAPFSKMSGLVNQKFLNSLASLYYSLAKGKLEGSKSYSLGEIRALRYRMDNLKKKLMKADMIIAPSKLLRDRAVRYGIPEEKIVHILNGIKHSNLPVKKSKSAKIRFGFIGRVVPIKGVHVLIKAFNELDSDSAELRIYGAADAGYLDKLKNMATSIDDIQFLGRFEPHEVYNILSEIDVLVIPSICCENMPLVALEALTSKTPVIASNAGGLSELINDKENGFLFPMGNDKELCKRMKLFLEDPNTAQKLIENIKPVKSIEENAHDVEEIYMRVLGAAS